MSLPSQPASSPSGRDRFEVSLRFDGRLVGVVHSAYRDEWNWYGDFESATTFPDDPVLERVRDFIRFSIEWHTQQESDFPPDAKEFDQFKDVVDSGKWSALKTETLEAILIEGAPVFWEDGFVGFREPESEWSVLLSGELNRHFPPLEIGWNVASQVVEETRRLEAILTSGIPHYWISRKSRPDPVIGFAWHGDEAAMNLLAESGRWTTLRDARVDPQESILIPISRNSADGVFVPRRCFVPLDQAIRAVQEFAEGTDLPAAVKWEALFQEPGKSQRPVSPRQLHLAFGDE